MENIGSGPGTVVDIEAYSAVKKRGLTSHIWLLSGKRDSDP